jgi:hypothetical protein
LANSLFFIILSPSKKREKGKENSKEWSQRRKSGCHRNKIENAYKGSEGKGRKGGGQEGSRVGGARSQGEA